GRSRERVFVRRQNRCCFRITGHDGKETGLARRRLLQTAEEICASLRRPEPPQRAILLDFGAVGQLFQRSLAFGTHFEMGLDGFGLGTAQAVGQQITQLLGGWTGTHQKSQQEGSSGPEAKSSVPGLRGPPSKGTGPLFEGSRPLAGRASKFFPAALFLPV